MPIFTIGLQSCSAICGRDYGLVGRRRSGRYRKQPLIKQYGADIRLPDLREEIAHDAVHMSAFGGKADMTVCGSSHSRSLLGVKRTCPFALHMSAFDPKRTWASALQVSAFGCKADTEIDSRNVR